MLVDTRARNRTAEPLFTSKSFFGQLQHIFVVPIPSTPSLGIEKDTVLLLAGIHQCEGLKMGNGMAMPYYSRMGKKEVVDIASVQCLVGRIPLPANRWAIIDRTGDLQRSIYAPEDE